MFNLEQYLEERKRLVDAELDARLPKAETRPDLLHKAMRYSVMAGGKRFRPILCLAVAEAVGASYRTALLPAAAIEILHTYTLIHDDLPAMDNDSLRRGKPTSHVVYGEANAILAGDALLTMAFEWMGRCRAPLPYQANRLVVELAQAAGSQGVIGGQCEDMAAEDAEPSLEKVEYIHTHKTALLIRASVRIGAMVGGADESALNFLSRYGEKMGLVFQIVDDILNETSSAEMLGKAVGSDRAHKKMTYVSVCGLEAARARAVELTAEAVSAVLPLKEFADPLVELARFVVSRAR